MTAPFDDQTQFIFPGEIDRRDNIAGCFGRHCVNAGLRRPRVDPTGGLRQARIVSDVKRISQRLEELFALGAVGHLAADSHGGLNLDQPSFDQLTEPFPFLLRWPLGIARSNARKRRVRAARFGARRRLQPTRAADKGSRYGCFQQLSSFHGEDSSPERISLAGYSSGSQSRSASNPVNPWKWQLILGNTEETTL